MNILVAGGGTGGHVVPVLAVSAELKRRGAKVLVVGRRHDHEASLVRQAGFEYKAISGGKLRRYWSWHNLIDPFKVIAGFWQSLALVGRTKPDVVFGKGGFVALPVVWAAWFRRVPVVIHESDAVPGLSNRLSAKVAKAVAVAFPPEKMTGLKRAKLVQTGNPIRDAVTKGTAERARQQFSLDESLPTVLILGGSQGSANINRAVDGALEELLPNCQIVHQVGPKLVKDVADRITRLPESLRDRYHTRGFFDSELFDLYAVADLVVSRAGGGIAEIAAVGKPMVLIPLGNSASDHQQANAEIYKAAGAAEMIQDEDLTTAELIRVVRQLLKDSHKRSSMARNAAKLASPDAAAKLADLIWKTGEKRAG